MLTAANGVPLHTDHSYPSELDAGTRPIRLGARDRAFSSAYPLPSHEDVLAARPAACVGADGPGRQSARVLRSLQNDDVIANAAGSRVCPSRAGMALGAAGVTGTQRPPGSSPPRRRLLVRISIRDMLCELYVFRRQELGETMHRWRMGKILASRHACRDVESCRSSCTVSGSGRNRPQRPEVGGLQADPPEPCCLRRHSRCRGVLSVRASHGPLLQRRAPSRPLSALPN